MNVEQAIITKMERSEKCWPRSEMTAAEILTAIGGDPESYDELMRVARFMPHFCMMRVHMGMKRYVCRLKLEAVEDGADSVTNR